MAYKFTLDLKHCTANVDNTTEYNSGDIVDIVLTANDYSLFSNPYYKPYLTYIDKVLHETTKKYFTVSADQKTATYTLTVNSNTTITAEATFEGISFNTSNIQFATCNIKSDDVFQVGESIEISIIANDGYYFAQIPYIAYFNASGDMQKIILETSQTGEHLTAFSTNITFTEDMKGETLAIYAVADIIPKTDKYGIITVYNPTAEELKEIGDTRYMVLGGESTGIIDLGAYISSLIKVYVNLPESNKANVKLGGINTGVSSAVLLDDIVETNCGTIEISGKYGNLMDYKNTTVEIYLPFIGFEKLETDKVMNEVISLIYKTNIINGDSIACIYNTTGVLLYTFNCNVAFEIPYKTSGTYDDRSNLKIDSNYLFGFTPFVTIRTNKSYNTTRLTANDNRIAQINELHGFIACSEVFNTIKATTQEKEEIDRILKDGIILDDVVETDTL